jgi:hypothetical protein
MVCGEVIFVESKSIFNELIGLFFSFFGLIKDHRAEKDAQPRLVVSPTQWWLVFVAGAFFLLARSASIFACNNTSEFHSSFDHQKSPGLFIAHPTGD